MEIWIWFDENEGILSGIAAALVIFGALSTVGRGFVLRLFGFNKRQNEITLAELSKPSPHKVQFANSDGVKIAFTEQGKTSPDLIITPGIISNLHVFSNLPPIRDTMAGLAKFSRVINFDKRGQGLSDPVAEVALAWRARERYRCCCRCGRSRPVCTNGDFRGRTDEHQLCR